MRKLATILALLALPLAAQAQVPQSTVYARNVGGATMTLDGTLSESVWQQAEKLEFKWDAPPPGYSSGQQLEGNPTLVDPSDPLDATVYFLRDGNTLWIGIDARDKSIWGNRGDFFNNDGVLITMQNRRTQPINPTDNNRFGGGIAEFIYNWRNPRDTTAAGLPAPGAMPRFVGTFSGYGSDGVTRNPEARAVWDAMTTVNGTSNDDATDDVGYVMEMRIQVDSLGFDFTQPGGDVIGLSVTIGDRDYSAPNDTRYFGQRVFWESKWGNTFIGVGWLKGSPDVTVTSGNAGMTSVGPDVTAPMLGSAAPVIDGMLDEGIWNTISPAFSLRYKDQDVLEDFPGIGLSGIRYFRPTPAGADANALVTDTSLATFKMFFKGDRLYVGVHVEDQVLSGVAGEGGRDGFRLVFDRLDSLRSDGTPFQARFDFAIAPGGDTLQFDGDVAMFRDMYPGFLDTGVHVDGTVDDPNDLDVGYSIELSIDLKALGYPAGLGDHMVHLTPAFFDGDFLLDAAASYAYRIWYGRERGGQGVPLFVYLDESTIVAREHGETPGRLTVTGVQPNPFSGEATLRYTLGHPSEVTIEVFDLLGRRVASVDAGIQAEGDQRVTLDGRALAAGLYLYRIEAHAADGRVERATGRMVLAR